MLAVVRETPAPDVEAQADAAQAELTRLRAEAARLEAEADQAEAAFKNDPSEKRFALRAVLDQRAKNALEAITAFEGSVAEVMQEASRIRGTRDLQALRKALDFETLFGADRERLEELTANYIRDTRALFTAAVEKLEHLATNVGRLNDLERQFGDGGTRSHVNLPELMRRFSTELESVFGRVDGHRITKRATFRFNNAVQGEEHTVIEIAFPIDGVSHRVRF